MDKSGSSMAARIEVQQAIAALLQRSHGPLTKNEIRQRLIAIRGVGANFQIHSTELIVRLPDGRWGLNDRDVPLKRPDQGAFFSRLENVLRSRGNGIHITEVEDVVRDEIEKNVPVLAPETIFSLAANYERLKVTAGEYLFLAEWSDARRETLMKAVVETLRTANGRPLSTNEIVGEVERQTERRCDKRAVISCLQATDAIFNASTGEWFVASETPQTESDELETRPRKIGCPRWKSLRL